MNKEELKKLCKEEFLKNIKEYIKSETIFTYVDGLEKENKKQKEILDKIKEYIKEHIRIDDEYPDYMEMLANEYYQLLELLEEIE